MQTLLNQDAMYKVEIEATCHTWRKPFVWLFESLFRAGDAVRLGKTTLFVRDRNGHIIHQEYFGNKRKAAWYRQLEIENKMKTIDPEEFVKWLKN